jgi:hypothetical protein
MKGTQNMSLIVGEKRDSRVSGGRQFCAVCLKTITTYETRTLYLADGGVRTFYGCPEHGDKL